MPGEVNVVGLSGTGEDAAIPYSVRITTTKEGLRYSIENAENAGKTRIGVASELEAVVRDLRGFEQVPALRLAD